MFLRKKPVAIHLSIKVRIKYFEMSRSSSCGFLRTSLKLGASRPFQLAPAPLVRALIHLERRKSNGLPKLVYYEVNGGSHIVWPTSIFETEEVTKCALIYLEWRKYFIWP